MSLDSNVFGKVEREVAEWVRETLERLNVEYFGIEVEAHPGELVIRILKDLYVEWWELTEEEKEEHMRECLFADKEVRLALPVAVIGVWSDAVVAGNQLRFYDVIDITFGTAEGIVPSEEDLKRAVGAAMRAYVCLGPA